MEYEMNIRPIILENIYPLSLKFLKMTEVRGRKIIPIIKNVDQNLKMFNKSDKISILN